MASFEAFSGRGIHGHDDKVYSNIASVQECIKKCKTERSFVCKSLEFKQSHKHCVLSRVDQRGGGGLRIGGVFANYMYLERKCKANNVLTEKKRRVAGFGDGCTSRNCYSKCGESTYMNKMLDTDVVNLRFLRLDLSSLDGILRGKSPSKVVITAQTIVQSREVNFNYDVVLIARQVKLSGHAIRYKNANIGGCVTSNLYHDCTVSDPLRLISYFGNGRMDIYTESISGARCSAGRKISETPDVDVTALKAALACAEDMATSSASGYDTVSYNIANYVSRLSFDTSAFPSRTVALSMRSAAVRLVNYMDTRKAGLRPVPLMSQKSYTEVLNGYSSIFQMYHRKYDAIFASNTNINNRVADINVAVQSARDSLRLQQKRREFAATRVQESTAAITKLNEEFQKAQTELAEAKDVFDAGMNKYKQQQSIKAGFQFAQMAGQIMSAAAGVAGAKGSDSKGAEKAFEFIESITDLVTSIADLIVLIADMTDLAATFATIAGWSDSVNSAVQGKTTPAKAEDVMASAEKAASMRVKMVVWDTLRNKGDTMLTAAPMPDIGGSADYHNKLADVSNWGKAYTQQVLDHAGLVNDYIVKSLACDAAQVEVDAMARLLSTAKSNQASLRQLLKDVSDETIESLLSAVRVITSYSKSFFFYNLREMDSTNRIHLSDSLTSVQSKLARLGKEAIEAKKSFGYRTPHEVTAHYVLKDTQTRGCTNPAKCPISFLKSGKPLLFYVPMNAKNFIGLDRLRLDEIRVFINNIHFNNDRNKVISVNIDHASEMSDRLSGKTFNFLVTDRKFTFRYDYRTRHTLTSACLASSVSSAYHKITPFGVWTIQIDNRNRVANLNGITSVEIYFSVSALQSNVHRPEESGLRYKTEGVLSDECSRPSAGKRSISSEIRYGGK